MSDTFAYESNATTDALNAEIERLRVELEAANADRSRFLGGLNQIACWEDPEATDDYNRAWHEASTYAIRIIGDADDSTLNRVAERLEAVEQDNTALTTRLAELEEVTDGERLTVDLLVDWKSSHMTYEASRLDYLAAKDKFDKDNAALRERIAELETVMRRLHADPNIRVWHQEWIDTALAASRATAEEGE